MPITEVSNRLAATIALRAAEVTSDVLPVVDGGPKVNPGVPPTVGVPITTGTGADVDGDEDGTSVGANVVGRPVGATTGGRVAKKMGDDESHNRQSAPDVSHVVPHEPPHCPKQSQASQLAKMMESGVVPGSDGSGSRQSTAIWELRTALTHRTHEQRLSARDGSSWRITAVHAHESVSKAPLV